MSHQPTVPILESVYLYKDGYQSGPFTPSEARELLQAMGDDDVFYWAPPMNEWRPAGEFGVRASTLPYPAIARGQVLVVDDDPVMRELIKLQIAKLSTHVRTAENIGEARRILQESALRAFDCVISDYSMPGGTGVELLYWIRENRPGLEVILLTARDDKEIVKEALRGGIFDFLEKPIADRELVRSVQSAISRTQGNRKHSSSRYTIESLLGKGGMGEVYRAWDRHLDRPVAFKRLLTGEGISSVGSHELIEEALRLAKLQHPHIVNVHDCGTDSEGPFMVLELLDGITMEQFIDNGERLDAGALHLFTCQCLDALAHAHAKGFLHLDLKPSNIMTVRMSDGRLHIKILDFGIARFTGTAGGRIAWNGEPIFGSPVYMAPERFAASELDARSDLYSLGCVIYHLASGEEPFSADEKSEIARRHFQHDIEPLGQLAPELGAEFCQWVMRLLCPKMSGRPASAQEAKSSLPPPAGPASPSQPPDFVL